jgi:hypothetical protein
VAASEVRRGSFGVVIKATHACGRAFVVRMQLCGEAKSTKLRHDAKGEAALREMLGDHSGVVPVIASFVTLITAPFYAVLNDDEKKGASSYSSARKKTSYKKHCFSVFPWCAEDLQMWRNRQGGDPLPFNIAAPMMASLMKVSSIH